MTSVLFVCLGNICRSPTAEAVFQDRIDRAGLADRIRCDSAGIIAAHEGQPADSRMRQHANKRGYHLHSISRPVTTTDFDRFDWVIGMDHQNIRDLHKRAPSPEHAAKIRLMLTYDPDVAVEEVPDPYYGGAAGFEEVLDLLESSCDALLNAVR